MQILALVLVPAVAEPVDRYEDVNFVSMEGHRVVFDFNYGKNAGPLGGVIDLPPGHPKTVEVIMPNGDKETLRPGERVVFRRGAVRQLDVITATVTRKDGVITIHATLFRPSPPLKPRPPAAPRRPSAPEHPILIVPPPQRPPLIPPIPPPPPLLIPSRW
jgi:hypothetical protein